MTLPPKDNRKHTSYIPDIDLVIYDMACNNASNTVYGIRSVNFGDCVMFWLSTGFNR
jgi:hypothetical protein